MAKIKGADLRFAKMQGADLSMAKMQGANLFRAELSEVSELTDAALRGASVSSVDDITISQLLPFRYDIFADSTVQLPEGVSRPEHWHPCNADDPERLDYDGFETRWRDWQRSIGQDPENPE
ncbi:pentapeptide repeat-containing protein [Salipiger sp. CCB-MM3]|uniref:pentapeptide repeat-containing protein n=1 Tax=Salipiger sp. CCB-MM3 TaxID=1792508 RepID=UPI001F3DC322|nr:pentapeptide repeat-containing protein [Salipiger sp. CCB-MM3]